MPTKSRFQLSPTFAPPNNTPHEHILQKLHQWLDILQAMATLKYPELQRIDPGNALAQLLSNHILSSAPALGIAEAVRSGLLKVQAAAPGPLFAGPRSRSPNRSSGRLAPSTPGIPPPTSSSPSSTSTFAAPPTSSSPSSSSLRDGDQGGSNDNRSSSSTAFAAYMQAAAAQMAALAAQAASAAEKVTSLSQPESSGSKKAPSEAWENALPQAGSPSQSSSPSAVYKILARTAKEFQVAAAAAVTMSSSDHASHPLQAPPPKMSSSGSSSPRQATASHASSSPSSLSNAPSLAGGPSFISTASQHATLRLASPNPFRAVNLAGGEFVISAQSLGTAGSGASRPFVPPRSPGGGRYDNLGTNAFIPALAGEANAPGSVYARLANPDSFTGVYKRAWETDGRINQYADTSASLKPSQFVGNTNTRTDEIITDIRTLLRPNLAHQPAVGVHRGGRPAFK